jgi:hypothetical protein
MASNKVVINLATGLEDSERVTVAFLVGGVSLSVATRRAHAIRDLDPAVRPR